MTANKKKLTRREADRAKFTHDAYIFKSEGVRRGKKVGYWEQEGYARNEPDGDITVYLHSTPIGGFNGRIVCKKYGSEQPADEEVEEEPQRPGQADGGDGGEQN